MKRQAHCGALRAALLAAALLAAAAAVDECRLRIPNSGGASQRPSSFSSAAVRAVGVPPNTFVDYAPPGEAAADFCGGPPACERACCSAPACLAWGWTVGGSAHALCGANACEAFVLLAPANASTAPDDAPDSSAAWAAAADTATLWGGYNYAGYVFRGPAEKAACCAAGAAGDATPAPTASAPSPPAPPPPPPPSAPPSSTLPPSPAPSAPTSAPAAPASTASATLPAPAPAPASDAPPASPAPALGAAGSTSPSPALGGGSVSPPAATSGATRRARVRGDGAAAALALALALAASAARART